MATSIVIGGGDNARETFELTEAARAEKEQQEKLLAEFEVRRRMMGTVVPTDDLKVRSLLRQLAEPVTLFGEREMERRERLRKLLAQREATGEQLEGLPTLGAIIVEEAPTQTETFYTEGTERLKEAREALAQRSLRRAAARLARAKRQRDDEEAQQACDEALAAERSDAEAAARRLAQQSSELADTRPVGAAAFSPDGAQLATCGWGGMVALWQSDPCARTATFRAHDERCTDVKWHPQAALGHSPDAANLITGCADGTAALWSAGGQQLRRLEGHTSRLARVAWHPAGSHVATASFDHTWRLWDVATGECLLEQEGHSRGVYGVAFHPDGSLAGSAGLDAYGRVWDCRTGRSVLVLEGHVKQVLAIDFCPDGVRLATGSEDHTVRVWDLRKRGCVYTIPGHRSLVSAVRWQRGGHWLLSAGYDCVAKVWSGKDYSLLKTLAGHEGKVMGADVAPSGELVATAAYDRTLKMWAPEAAYDLDMF